jgi:hypothetical protein
MKKDSFNTCIFLMFSMTILFLFSTLQAQERIFERIIKDSQFIILGNVKSINSNWDDGKRNIWTYITFEPKQFLKGNINSKEIVIKIPGGKIGNIEEIVSGTPKYKVGEFTITFLGKENEKYYYVNGWDEGKYTYKEGKWVKKEVIYSDQLIPTIKSIVEQQFKTNN